MLAAALAIAAAWWGPGQCATPVVRVNELGTWRDMRVLGRATRDTCLLELDPGSYRWWKLCAVVVHEAGHLRGLGHSEDPRSVMHAPLERTAEPCRGRRPASYPAGSRIRLEPAPLPAPLP